MEWLPVIQSLLGETKNILENFIEGAQTGGDRFIRKKHLSVRR